MVGWTCLKRWLVLAVERLFTTPTARILVVLDAAQTVLHDQRTIWMFVDALRRRLVSF